MSKLILSVRITENFFTTQEIKKIKKEIKSCQNKSEFIRKAIKTYLQTEANNKQTNNNIEKIPTNELKELKNLIKDNQDILKDIRNNKIDFKNNKTQEEVYQGEKQKQKTDQALNLLNQF